jgi:thioredoxin reductase
MEIRRRMLSRIVAAGIMGMFAAVCAGCGVANRTAKFDQGYTPKPGTKIQAGTVTNETGKTPGEIDVVKALSDELDKALEKKNLKWTSNIGGDYLVLPCKILEYEEGSAFKRWLLPGWGSTALSVHCDLTENTGGKTVGSVDARRTVDAGGLYTVGAWKTVFVDIAGDMATELEEKIVKGSNPKGESDK